MKIILYIFAAIGILATAFITFNLLSINMELNLAQNPAVYYAKRTASYSEIIKNIEDGKVREVTIQNNQLTGFSKDNQPFYTHLINTDNTVKLLLEKNVKITVLPSQSKDPTFLEIFLSWLPLLILVSLFYFTVSRPMLNMQKSIKAMQEGFKSETE